ncbi:ubiquitin-specific protease UBP14 [Ascoidea rubescens DSM 1968]|uniref:Ubiquitin carboxyl-terminal hydrolase n=1 Tax=Ascoidea rubescens DSM 1968 TaxID=1344418 RepID=A0A1D2VI07_9ASCO|nr:ubiquitinyl hydrolase [Ascoidea rubescens DSM 1968]ODV61252.1 ubiquitinyl hydrolase [Ascoidea rubescens DSM 1968]
MKFSNTNSISPPSVNQTIYKDDCTYCFQTPDLKGGLNICLHCYRSFCPLDIGDESNSNHAALHNALTGHNLFLNYTEVFKRDQIESNSSINKEEKIIKMAKLEIKEKKKTDLFNFYYNLLDLENQSSIALDIIFKNDVHSFNSFNGLPQILIDTVLAILNSKSSYLNQEVESWEQEIKTCKHSSSEIEQLNINNPSINLKKCAYCDLNENLWLCLYCGFIGCGRQQFGGLKGNSHALNHFNETNHPIAIKLGSLSLKENKADCYCYSCNDEIKVPDLSTYLLNYGINIQSLDDFNIKKEKTLTELNIEQNIKWSFNMTSNDGQLLRPLFGESLTGLKNLGNSCYISSIIQVLFDLKCFQDYFYQKDFLNVKDAINGDQGLNLRVQLIKIANGLISGKYSTPNLDTPDDIKFQRGIALNSFKNLVGTHNKDFKSMQQQDAFEFLLFLLETIENYYYSDDLDLNPTNENLIDNFKFVSESKLTCSNCRKYKFINELTNYLSLPIKDELKEISKENKKIYKDYSLIESLNQVFSNKSLDVELNCENCLKTTFFNKEVKLKTLPNVLVLSAQRVKLENWVPIKVDVPLILPEVVNLGSYVSKIDVSKVDPNDLLPTNDGEGDVGDEFIPNVEVMNALLSMGFPENRCVKALYNVDNSGNPDDAMNWLFANMDDPSIDEPVVIKKKSKNQVKEPSSGDVSSLTNMGFEKKVARKALILNEYNIERAVDWLFSNPEDDGVLDEVCDGGGNNKLKKSTKPSMKEEIEAFVKEFSEEKSSEYYLKSVVCHKGTSIYTGHYVCFVRREIEGRESWVLFNDEKVVLANDENNLREIMNNGYLFIYVRRE